MNVYCTLFDSNYLTRGLAMYKSLLATDEDFLLYIFAFDEYTKDFFQYNQFKNVVVVSMKEFENDRLLRIKKTRKINEYCYTCSSFSILHVLMNYHHDEVTYIDADVYFFQKPGILLDEFHASGKDVMITEHRYAPQYNFYKDTSGIYCVQFMTFKNNKNALQVLNWWCDRCDEWCYERYEDGKMGDQKYLDDWTKRFEGIHVLEHLGGGVAPWNVRQYTCSAGPRIDNVPIVFYHFHAFRWFSYDEYFPASGYYISEDVERYVYKYYILALQNAIDFIHSFYDKNFSGGFSKIDTHSDDRMEIVKGILSSKGKDVIQVLVYGAGDVGRKICHNLNECGVENFEVVVSKGEVIGRYCCGKKVKCIDDFILNRDESIILVAVGRQYKEEVLGNLNRLGFKNVIK